MSNLINLGKTGVLVAARMGSSRLPGKALRKLGDKPMILFLLTRLKRSQLVDKLVFCTTELDEDDRLAEIVESEGYEVFRGSNNDVVKRYVDAAQKYQIDTVIRVTGDCPFVDGESLDYCLSLANEMCPFDLVTTKGNFPVGIDYEIYSSSVMSDLYDSEKLSKEEREHLTLYMYNNSDDFHVKRVKPKKEWCDNKNQYTVDTSEDYELACRYVHKLKSNFSIDQLLKVTLNEV
jgi:spore coat polysaccharide biosynthesis protein SpsF